MMLLAIISFAGGFVAGGLVFLALVDRNPGLLARTPVKNHSVTHSKLQHVPLYLGVMVPDHCHTGQNCEHCKGSGYDIGGVCLVCYGTGADLKYVGFILWKNQLS